MSAQKRALWLLREQYRRYLEEASGFHEWAQNRGGAEWSQVWAREQAIVALHRLHCTDLAWIISGNQPAATSRELRALAG